MSGLVPCFPSQACMYCWHRPGLFWSTNVCFNVHIGTFSNAVMYQHLERECVENLIVCDAWPFKHKVCI